MELDGIAIIGMAGRFPGARTTGEFWRNVKNGVESISRFAGNELEVSDAARLAADPGYVKARAVLEDVDLFDASFFGILPQEAKLMDPQHRVFLECCWEAIENAGYDPSTDPSTTGVFAGCSQNSYFLRQVAGSRAYLDQYTSAYQVGFYQAMLGTIADTLATRVAYKLNLKGPAITMMTACSTSLVAVVEAVKSLLVYECDQALAGGVSITFPQKRGYLYQGGGMVSPDGHCRPFDADAQGTVFGSGAGVVLLKRLEDAVQSRDHIYAVIKGSAINNDGSLKVAFTAPSVEGQARAIHTAQAAAGIEPRTISYIEAHGTGTPLGDPIEVAALTKVFRANTDARAFCALGTVKANLGHLDIAAGVTGLIKTALSLEHRQLPPQIHFRKPNPRLELESSPFYVNTELREWRSPDGGPLRAGVSAFGVGGTNAHVVLEEAPAREQSPVRRPCQLLTLSAKSTEALDMATSRLADYLQENPEVSISDAAYTLQTGRTQYEYRRALVCRNGVAPDWQRALTALARREAPSIHFLFPGQGVQHIGMGQELYEHEPVFRQSLDRCSEILAPHIGFDLRKVLYPSADEQDAARTKRNATVLAQPAIFAVEYALAQLWMSWGVRPKAMLGHSIGEFVAACLAGVFSLEEALGLVAARGRMMQDLPGGAMLSVRLSESALLPHLNGQLSIAAVNAPSLCVVAGPYAEVDALESKLQGENIVTRRLHTSHAFHSAMMDPIIEPFIARVQEVRLRAPSIPYVSCVTGTWITPSEAMDAGYWARHFRQTVRFADAVSVLAQDQEDILLETGPGTTLQTLARQQLRSGKTLVLSSLPEASSDRSASEFLYHTAGSLWTVGTSIDWREFHAGEDCQRVPLPGYPFERKRFWAEPSPDSQGEGAISASPAVENIITAKEVAMGSAPSPAGGRKDRILSRLGRMFQDLSGLDISEIHPAASFLELGFDSLFLTQAAQSLQSDFRVKITFRQLLDQLSSLEALAAYLDEQLAPDFMAEAPAVAPPVSQPSTPLVATAVSPPAGPPVASAGVAALMQEQLRVMSQLMAQQLEALRGSSATAAVPGPSTISVPTPAIAEAVKPEQEFKPFGPYKPIQKAGAAGDLTAQQQSWLTALIERYTNRTAGSKQFTQRYRKVLADPRVVSGFRKQWKEMVYPIVTNRSCGSRLWDVDGNEYIDILNGFGPTAFGHRPDFVEKAVEKQLHEGIEIGPQTPLAGEVAELICELTGVERATFCNTGSEAVMAAVRVARTVTGRKKIALFAGSYHGTFDEVLVKRTGKPEALRSNPIAPGIPAEKTQNVIVLDYGDPAALEIVRQHGQELAAVLVEPVQSRHPALQPREFLQQLRQITADCGTALILDEVVTGFRVHPGGVQKLFGIAADLVTYGKVLGGGLPIGVLAGKSTFMDALDGGMWQYGDDSIPEVGVTFFAGTFVRHPLALAAAKAVLEHLKQQGPGLQERLTARTQTLVNRLNQLFERNQVPTHVETFGSLFYFGWPAEFRFGSLLYYLLRERGIHLQEGFPCFLTTAHSDEDLDLVYRAFAESVTEMRAGGFLPGVAEEIREAPMTEEQLEIWLSAQLGPEASCSFNESFTVALDGELDERALKESIQDLVNRHDALRATFDPEGKLVRFAAELSLDIPLVECSSAELDQAIAAEAATPFDLEHGPLFRVKLMRLSARQHAALFTAHHIVCDGWSTNVLLTELSSFYNARRAGKTAALPVPLAFSRYALNESQRKTSGEEYWLEQFRELPPLLDLPLDRARKPEKSFQGSTVRHRIGASLAQELRKSGAKEGCTLFATLLAGFEALLVRLSGQRDVVVGVPMAGQTLLGDQVLVGHCVNFLPFRGKMDEETTFSSFRRKLQSVLLDAREHQQFTFGTLVRKLGVKREPGRLPLIEVQFNLEKVGSNLDFQGLQADVDACPKRFVNFDLFLNVVEKPDGLILDCDYNTDLFDAATISRWLEHYETLLAATCEDAAQKLLRLPLLTAAARHHLVVDMNRTEAPFPDCCIHELFEQQARRTPDAVAVVDDSGQFTYAELDERAGHLANHLCRKGVGPGELVGLYLDRSRDLVVALLGILKAGGAYVPLDPAYPRERVAFILEQAGVRAVVSQQSLAGELPELSAPIISLDSQWPLISGETPVEAPARPCPGDRVHVIYTSGSTGKPKGVEIEHRGLVNLLWSLLRDPGMGPEDRLLAVTTIAFDMGGLEIFMPLICGARVVIASRDMVADGLRLQTRLAEEKINVMQATPTTWRMLLEAGWTPGPRMRMICGGEPIPRKMADALLSGGGFYNGYGPTETTIYSAFCRVEPSEGPVTMGPPPANTQLYVLDALGQVVPMGVPGELYIGGTGVARGYFKRPDLTAERFLPDPFHNAEGARMYRTGDLVRRLPNGHFEYLGRLDNQVKIRGFRIELGEIEATLSQHEAITEVAVVVAGDSAAGDKKLAAYYTMVQENAVDPADLRQFLLRKLPGYMVPHVLVPLASFPRTPNGKLDRKALPAPNLRIVSKAEYKAPRDESERNLAEICCVVLERQRIGIDENLFELGADSLLIFQIAARAQRMNILITALEILRNPTIEGMVAQIKAKAEAPASRRSITRASRTKYLMSQPAAEAPLG